LPPDFVVIGHLTRDERPAGYGLGGTATYAAITARNLGYRAGILTRAAANLPQAELLDQIEIARLDSPCTTTFRNIYHEGHRRQFVHDIARPIDSQALPLEWRDAKIALLGPVIGEVQVDTTRAFDSRTLIGVVPQGWLRDWDDAGRVRPRDWSQAPDILPYARVLVLSEEDLGEFADRLNDYIGLTEIVVLTRGARGCTVFEKGHEPFDSPAFHANEFDPTGAGDVFAAAFLIRLHETGDVVEAARFANCVASFAVEAEGVTGIPTRAMVEQRLLEG
jgi:sugar/nucleoside kinase (ribokinase family)